MHHAHGKAARVWLLIPACLIVSCVSAHAAEKTCANSIGMEFVLRDPQQPRGAGFLV